MRKQLLPVAIFLIAIAGVSGAAQRPKPVAPYKITAIRVLPFDASEGKFLDELKPDDAGNFFNDLDKSLLVLVEIAGPAGEYAASRKVSVRVTEGKKLKLAKTGFPGVINENGKFWVPVWLESAMCDQVTITASLVGQTQKSSMKRSLSFLCGE